MRRGERERDGRRRSPERGRPSGVAILRYRERQRGGKEEGERGAKKIENVEDSPLECCGLPPPLIFNFVFFFLIAKTTDLTTSIRSKLKG